MELNLLKSKMDAAIVHFEKELSSIRTSRANISMLDNILVDSYGTKTPINQLGNISTPDASTITVQVWDSNLVKTIESAISDSNLGINPQSDGTIIRLPIPKLSEERRNELSKIASEYAENAKISIRNLRRDALDSFKDEEKEKIISQDEHKKKSTEVQKITDSFIKKIDEIAENKKNEIIKV
tara:strand:+ start:1710 stop:2258 length:549 start_codon:yes stop_codon:yes gene_type:complete